MPDAGATNREQEYNPIPMPQTKPNLTSNPLLKLDDSAARAFMPPKTNMTLTEAILHERNFTNSLGNLADNKAFQELRIAYRDFEERVQRYIGPPMPLSRAESDSGVYYRKGPWDAYYKYKNGVMLPEYQQKLRVVESRFVEGAEKVGKYLVETMSADGIPSVGGLSSKAASGDVPMTGIKQAEETSFSIYTVNPKDELWQIAEKYKQYGVSVQDIVEANSQITNRDYIQVGWKLKIPHKGVTNTNNTGGIPDITDKLNNLMQGHDETYKYVYLLPIEMRLHLFYNLVRNGGPFDLKNNPEWQYDQFIYNGEVVDKDVPGNINYGYLGKVFGFPDTLLYAAAGFAQIRAGTSQPEWRNLNNWGDDPRDTYRIGQGIEIYRQRHKEP